MRSSFETVIGLEVHAQLLTKSKLFCGCSTAYGAAPNTHVCPVCLGMPGALPVPNGRAIELATKAGLALGCEVREHSVFARKNYFYPDLPKGYQISQLELPLNEHGKLDLGEEGGGRVVTIQRIHVEEDAAKNIHGAGAGDQTLVDFNRGGTPLIEIVSAPDLRSSAEAEVYLRRLREVLMFCGVNDGNLEEGSFRCDANVSIRPVGQEELGTRTELKNINSFRFVRKAIDYEVARQKAVINGGGKVVQETRLWNENQGKTFSMRSKEEAMDYRYFPDPDLPDIAVTAEAIAKTRASLPELPVARRARYVSELGLTEADAGVITGHPEIAALFDGTADALIAQKVDPKKAGKRAANFIQSEVLRHVETEGLSAKIPVTGAALAELLHAVESDTISGKQAKAVFADMLATGKGATAIIEDKGMAQVSDSGELEGIVQGVIDGSPDNVAAYRGGKTGLLGWFVGQVMKQTKGSANPKLVNEILRKKLDG